jgi:addiction module RelE/StbE family toxin
MTIKYSKGFLKQAKKLSPELRQQLQERLVLFDENPLNPTLRNHALKGKYKDYRSISVTGDVRVLYLQSGDEVIFDAVGTHSQLYG